MALKADCFREEVVRGRENKVCANMHGRVRGVVGVELGVADVGLRVEFLVCPAKEFSWILYL